MKSKTCLLIPLIILLVIPSCHREKKVRRVRLAMNTYMEITALGEDQGLLEDAVKDAFSEVKRIEHKFSAYQADSVISRINRGAGEHPVKVDEETIEIINESIRITELSDGAFDITFAPLAEIWNYKDPPKRMPADEELKPVLDRVGYKKIRVDPDRKTVFLEKNGMRIDLGGIAKGYAVDRAIKVLKDAGVKSALVNAGGDMRAFGRIQGRPFGVGIQDPRQHGKLMGRISLEDMAVATSGDYEKFFILEGKRLSHIIDPRTGHPAKGCRSVTIMAKRAQLADALSTAAFVMGPEKGFALIESLPELEAIIIDEDGKRKVSNGISERIEWF